MEVISLAQAAVWVMVLYFISHAVCGIHELAHLIAAKMLGVPVREVEFGRGRGGWTLSIGGTDYTAHLWPVEGTTHLDESRGRLRDLLVIGFSGPVVNMVIGALLVSLSPSWPWGEIAGGWSIAVGLVALLGVSKESDGARIRHLLRQRSTR